MLLLSFDAQQKIKPISANNRLKYDLMAQEVESLEINKLLGYAFYQAVSTNPGSYTNLLDGCEFIDNYGNTVNHKGLRYVIAYLNYSKYLGESYIEDTFTGFVKKVRQDSEPLSVGEVKKLQQELREIAFNAFELIRMYLNNNREIYPLWTSRSDKKNFKPKFYVIKHTHG